MGGRVARYGPEREVGRRPLHQLPLRREDSLPAPPARERQVQLPRRRLPVPRGTAWARAHLRGRLPGGADIHSTACIRQHSRSVFGVVLSRRAASRVPTVGSSASSLTLFTKSEE